MSNAKVTLAQVLEFCYSASVAERNSISQALNAARNDDILTARMEYKVGDKVKFDVKKRGYAYTVRGVITQKNVKTFHVRPNDGGREWKVTASVVTRDDQA